MPKSYRTPALVLRRYNFGEADRVISLLTRDHGKVRAVAKGVRRMKSKMAGHLELFSQVELQCAEGRNLDTITGARLLSTSAKLDYDSLQLAYQYAEMLEKLTDEGDVPAATYELAITGFGDLDANGPTKLGELYFKLRLLGLLGYEPQLTACAVCGRADATSSYAFSQERGGIVDGDHASASDVPASRNTIKLWRAVLNHGLSQLRGLADAEGEAAKSLPILDTFYEYTFDRKFITQGVFA